MTFRLVILSSFLAIARAGFINGGHRVIPGPVISGSYVSSGNLLRGESGQGYSSGYGYPVVATGRVFTPTVSSPVIIRPAGYGSSFSYGGRNLPVNAGGPQNYQSISSAGYNGRSISFPSVSPYTYSASPNLRGSGYIAGFPQGNFNTGAYGNGYSSSSNLQNYGNHQIPYNTGSQISHNNSPHGSFNGLANGYGF